MSESTKTIAFVAIAILSLAAAWATQPASADLDVASLVGENLTNEFTDSTTAKRLRIVDFNEDTATLREFEVAEEDGLWTIPSKEGYPADAERQMAEAATALMDREILAVASEDATDHEQYGVIDPTSPTLEVGQKGVGRYVQISDIDDEPLAELIIGREVKNTTNEQHYVRKAGQDIVYIVEIEAEPLSTRFEDWIEKDLLKLNSWDISEVEIKDYSAELVPMMTQQGIAIQVAWDPRSELVLAYDDSEGKWTPISLKKFNPNTEKQEEFQLADDEELNTEKLNGMKTALDDLKIVDVVRKPEGLSADLKAGEDFLDNREAITDLRRRGFAAIPASMGQDQEIISSEGEVLCTLNNGVEYVLRFGDLRMGDGSEQDNQEAAEGEESESDASGGDVQRYLFAMVRFNEDAVERPDLQELPELPEGATASEPTESEEVTEVTDETAADDGASSEQSADVATEEEEEEEETDESAATTEESETANTDESLAATRSPPGQGGPAAAGGASDASADAEVTDTETDSGTHSTESTDTTTTEDTAKSDAVSAAIAERNRIEKENQRKLDEYQQKLDEGRQTVKDLNLRFGDWYFVVSNDTFQKIRLNRDNVIKKKGTNDSASTNAASDTSAVGAPGTSVPGLPSIPGVGQ